MSDLSLNCLDNYPAELVRDLAKIFTDQHEAERRVVGVRQEIHAKTIGRGRKAMNGLGQCVANVDNFSYQYWNTRLPGCWNDKGFVKEFLRDNPAARVESKGTKDIMVGYTGLGGHKSKTFHKSYG